MEANTLEPVYKKDKKKTLLKLEIENKFKIINNKNTRASYCEKP